MTPTFRPARAGDLPAIVALLGDDEIASARESPGVDSAYMAAFAAIAMDPNQLLVVGEVDGQVVSTLQLTFIPGLNRHGTWRAQVEAVHVMSGMRGSGIGAAMMRAAVEEAQRRGCGLVQVTTDRRRTRAVAFYERLGFTDSHHGLKMEITPAPR